MTHQASFLQRKAYTSLYQNWQQRQNDRKMTVNFELTKGTPRETTSDEVYSKENDLFVCKLYATLPRESH